MKSEFNCGAAIFDPVTLKVLYLSRDEACALKAEQTDIKKTIFGYGISSDITPYAVIIDFESKNYEALYQNLEFDGLEKRSINQRISLNINGITSTLSGCRIVLTDQCNMTCSYCFVETNTGMPSITLDEIKEGLKLLIDLHSGKHELSYQWFGGEPLTKKNLIIEADFYAKNIAEKHGLTIRPTIVTNGTILNEDIIQHFADFNYGVGISLDGPPEKNKINRRFLSGKTTESTIERNISRLLSKNVHVGVNVTPTASNYLDIIDTVEYILELGVKFIYINSPIPIRSYWVEDGQGWANSLLKARLYALSRGAMVFSHLDRVYQSLDTRTPRVYEHVQGCGGLNVALLPGGRISVLDLNWKENKYIFPIEEIRNNPNLLSKAKKSLHPIPECNTCIAHNICGGPSINDQLLLGTVKPLSEYCRFFEAATLNVILDKSGLQ